MGEGGIMMQVSWWVVAVYEYPRPWDPGTAQIHPMDTATPKLLQQTLLRLQLLQRKKTLRCAYSRHCHRSRARTLPSFG